MTTSPRRLRVDPIACHAHGLCAEMLPELIELDEWGYPLVRPGRVPDHLRPDVRAAIHHCPTLALRIQSDPP
jgi:ferredoxin